MSLEKKIIERYHGGYYELLNRRLREKYPVYAHRREEIIQSCDDYVEALAMIISEGYPEGLKEEVDSEYKKLVNH